MDGKKTWRHCVRSLKRSAKHAAFYASRPLGINALVRWRRRHRLLVLCYHGVVPRRQTSYDYRYRNTVSADEFRVQMGVLKRSFHPIAPRQLIDFLQSGQIWPKRAVLVTFDDGFRNNLTHAAPILKELGIPALFHVTTGYIGRNRVLWTQELNEIVLQWPLPTIPFPDGSEVRVLRDEDRRIDLAEKVRYHSKRLAPDPLREYLDKLRSVPIHIERTTYEELYAFMSWDEVRRLSSGGFDVGSHTVEHYILSNLEKAELCHELIASKVAIEHEVGRPCYWIAYPNGGKDDFSTTVMEAANKAGYAAAFSLVDRLSTAADGPFAIARVGIGGHVPASIFHAKICGVHEYLRRIL